MSNQAKLYTKRELISLDKSDLIMIIIENKIEKPMEIDLDSETINSLNSILKEKTYEYTFAKLGEQIYKKIVWSISINGENLELIGTYMKPEGSVDGTKDKIIYLEPLTEDIIAETKTLGITYVSKKYFQEIFEMYSKKFNFSSHKKLSSLYEFNKQKENTCYGSCKW